MTKKTGNIIFISMIIGVILGFLGGLYMKLVNLIIYFAPIGVMALIGGIIAENTDIEQLSMYGVILLALR